MAILPIDVATMAPKSQEVSSVQTTQLHRGEQANVTLQENFNTNIVHDNQKPVEANKEERTENRYDESKKGKKRQQNQHRPQDDKQNEEQDKALEARKYPKEYGSNFDMKI